MNGKKTDDGKKIVSDEQLDRHERMFGSIVGKCRIDTQEGEQLVIMTEIALNLRALVGFVQDIQEDIQAIKEQRHD